MKFNAVVYSSVQIKPNVSLDNCDIKHNHKKTHHKKAILWHVLHTHLVRI